MNNINAATVLEIIQRNMSEESRLQLTPVIKLARNIPAFSGNMLELHFDRSDEWFDVAFRINDQYDKALLCRNSLNNTSGFIQQGYRQLINRYKTGFHHGIENVWFEYDAPFQGDPSLFFDMHRSSRQVREKAAGIEAVSQLFQFPFYHELSSFVDQVQSQGLHVVYAGYMFPRKSEAIRITIEGLTGMNLEAIVKRWNWQGDYALLATLRNKFLREDEKIVLSIDFSNRLGSRLGIEINGTGRTDIIEKLTQEKQCGKQQAQTVNNWAGTIEPWPAVASALSNLHRRTIGLIHKRINHFKFSIENQFINCKIYLYYCF